MKKDFEIWIDKYLKENKSLNNIITDIDFK